MHVTLRFLWIALIGIVSCRATPPQAPSRAASGKPRAARTVSVTSTGDLQPALDAAEPGDTIELLAGAAFSGNFRLPAKKGDRSEFITVQSSAVDRLPAGVRVTPLSADRMPRLVTMNSEPALVAAQGSHNWRIIGLELTTGRGVYAYDVIRVGDVDATSATAQPREIEFDRIYVHAHSEKGSKRGIFFNSNAVKLTNSYISEFKSEYQDAQAVAVCNGPGPYEISNNYLEGAGENIIFGGCDNGIVGVVPSDITFTRNHLFKPLSWQKEKWVIKNIFEVKMGRRIRIEGNVFENNWASGQSGFGILFTVRANGTTAEGKPFGLIEDVIFVNNKIINTPNGINILGQDDGAQNAGQGRRLTFRNNLFLGVTGRLFQVLQNPQDIVIENNTSISQDMLVMSENVTTGFVMRDNIFALGTYGIFGGGVGSGNNALKPNFPGAIVSFNSFIGDAGGYPTGNVYLKNIADALFVNAATNNFRLQANSPLRGKGRNGADPGVDMDVLEAATLNVSSASSTPRIAAVLNTVDHTSRVAPGGIISVLGSSLATSTVAQDTAPLPTVLADTTATMDGQPARLLYVSPEEIQAQIPSTAIAGRDLEVRIAYREMEAEPFVIPGANIKEAAPAILNYSVPGSDVIWALMKQANDKWNGPLGGGLALHPGERATLLAAGLGPTTPRVPDGETPPPGAPAKPDSAVELYVNDLVQQIDSVTAVLDAIGLFQIQFLLDDATPIGALDENWIRISTQDLESVPRRVQLAQPQPD